MTKKRPHKKVDLLSLIHQYVESGSFVETVHARQRQNEREIILPDILHVLMTGYHEKQKDQFDEAWKVGTMLFVVKRTAIMNCG